MNLTQAQLAVQTNVSQSMIAKLEQGKETINYDKAVELFTFLEGKKTSIALKKKKAKDVMVSSIVAVTSTDDIQKAKQLMESHDFSQLPVIENNHCIASITEKSIATAALSSSSPDDLKVKDASVQPFPTVHANEGIESLQ